MTDYFDVRYYGSTDINWELDRAESKRIFDLLSETPPSNGLDNVSLGDEVTFTLGELKGLRFIVLGLGHEGPKNHYHGLTLGLKQIDDDNELYVDGLHLNGLKVVKSVPTGMKVLRFKR